MAVPKVFISSTCFDLKELRDSLSRFVKSFGFEPVLSEHGDVFYHPDLHTHEACVHEVSNCQMFILLIGGRFGGTYIHDKEKSITNAEYTAAKDLGIPIFTYIKKSVLDNHHLFQANRKKSFLKDLDFPAVEKQEDAIHIFNFIDQVRKAPTNNAFDGFETSLDVESHLRKQWSGMFFDFLKNREVKEQVNVANVMLTALQNSNDKLEEMLKGLYNPKSREESSEYLESLDSKYAAIHFFEHVLQSNSNSSHMYLGMSSEIEELVAIEPVGKNWFEYLVALGCFKFGEFFDEEEQSSERTIDYCGEGFAEFCGFILDESRYHKEKKWFYENGLKKLSKEQRKSVLSKFLNDDYEDELSIEDIEF